MLSPTTSRVLASLAPAICDTFSASFTRTRAMSVHMPVSFASFVVVSNLPWNIPHSGPAISRESRGRCAGGNHARTERLGTAARHVDRRRAAPWTGREVREHQRPSSRRTVSAAGRINGQRRPADCGSSALPASQVGKAASTAPLQRLPSPRTGIHCDEQIDDDLLEKSRGAGANFR
jgi:hypothetical protein